MLDAYEIEGHGFCWEVYEGPRFIATFETEAALDDWATEPMTKHTFATWEAEQLAAEDAEAVGRRVETVDAPILNALDIDAIADALDVDARRRGVAS